MNNAPVQWRELTSLFQKLYPRTLQQVMDNYEAATVNFSGVLFTIYPQPLPRTPGFEIWGPPHLNHFPS